MTTELKIGQKVSYTGSQFSELWSLTGTIESVTPELELAVVRYEGLLNSYLLAFCNLTRKGA